MQVQHLLIDNLEINSSSLSGVVNSVMYDFDKPEWISPHQDRKGVKLGPMTLLGSDVKFIPFIFDEHKLVTEGPPAKTVFHYHDIWTVPDNSVYVISFPQGYLDDIFKIASHPEDRIGPIQRAFSDDQRIFYFSFFPYRCSLEIKVRLARNEMKVFKVANSEDVVNNSENFRTLVNGYAKELISPKTIATIVGGVISGIHKL